MISPDLSRLIDLRPFDPDPYVLTQRMLMAIQRALGPDGYEPLKGDPEAVLCEGLAVAAWELCLAANRAVWGTTQGVLSALGIPWDGGNKATARILVEGTSGTVIPLGTQVETIDSVLQQQYAFVTTQSATITDSNVTIPVVATLVGGGPNKLPINTKVSLSVSTTSISGVRFIAAPSGGRDPETSEEYYVRLGSFVRRFNGTLVTALDYKEAALGLPWIKRAYAVDAWDGSGSTPGSVLGHVTVVARGEVDLDSTAQELLRTTLQEMSVHDLTVHVKPVTLVPVDVVATIRRMPNADPDEVEANAIEAVTNYLSPNAWEWGKAVEPGELIELLGRDVVGSYTVVGTITPSSAVTIPVGSLPTAGTIDIIVVDPL
jgi:hypothetical protein